MLILLRDRSNLHNLLFCDFFKKKLKSAHCLYDHLNYPYTLEVLVANQLALIEGLNVPELYSI